MWGWGKGRTGQATQMLVQVCCCPSLECWGRGRWPRSDPSLSSPILRVEDKPDDLSILRLPGL